MGKILKFEGRVGTNKVGSDCTFTFEIDEEDLPNTPARRTEYIDKVAQEAMWESGTIDWSFEQVGEEEP